MENAYEDFAAVFRSNLFCIDFADDIISAEFFKDDLSAGKKRKLSFSAEYAGGCI